LTGEDHHLVQLDLGLLRGDLAGDEGLPVGELLRSPARRDRSVLLSHRFAFRSLRAARPRSAPAPVRLPCRPPVAERYGLLPGPAFWRALGICAPEFWMVRMKSSGSVVR